MNYLALSINGEFTEWIYCFEHKEWTLIDNENNCCHREICELEEL